MFVSLKEEEKQTFSPSMRRENWANTLLFLKSSPRNRTTFFLSFIFLGILPQTSRADMPQLNGGGGDELGANDEMISFKDEGEQEEKTAESVSADRDLDDVKSSLVNESENNSSSSDSEVSPRLQGIKTRTKENEPKSVNAVLSENLCTNVT